MHPFFKTLIETPDFIFGGFLCGDVLGRTGIAGEVSISVVARVAIGLQIHARAVGHRQRKLEIAEGLMRLYATPVILPFLAATGAACAHHAIGLGVLPAR